jgi:hypothetical protein
MISQEIVYKQTVAQITTRIAPEICRIIKQLVQYFPVFLARPSLPAGAGACTKENLFSRVRRIGLPQQSKSHPFAVPERVRISF